MTNDMRKMTPEEMTILMNDMIKLSENWLKPKYKTMLSALFELHHKKVAELDAKAACNQLTGALATQAQALTLLLDFIVLADKGLRIQVYQPS